MAQCPVCQSELSANFGVVVCGACQSALFIDFDGVPQIAGQEELAEQPVAPTEASENVESLNSYESKSEQATFEAAELPPSAMESEAQFDLSQPVWESKAEADADAIRAEELQVEKTNSQSAQDVFNEIIDFANSEIEDIAGLISFNIEIKGIDSLEVRESLLDELRDNRFGWQIDDIEASIDNGVLSLKGLIPAKAIVLVQRVSRLPLEISWTQNAL